MTEQNQPKQGTFLDRALAWIIRQRGYSLVAVDAVANGMMRPQGRPSDQAIMNAYAESPWVHMKGVRLASSMASLGYKVGVETDDGDFKEVKKTHPFVRLWKSPNPFLRGWDFRFLTELWIRSVGSCYWWLQRDGFGTPEQIYFIPATWAQPVTNRGRLERWRVRDPFNTSKLMDVRPRDLLWLRSPDPLEPYTKGLGDLLSLVTEIDTYEMASESDRRFFQNDATPPGAIIVPGRPSKEEVDNITDKWNERMAGPKNAGSVPVLFGGMDFKQFRQGRKEMDYIEGQRFLRDVILMGIHKHIVGVSDDVNFANAKAAEFTYARWELEPRVPWWNEHATVVAAEFDERLELRHDSPVPQDETLVAQKANEGLARGAIKRGEYRTLVFPELEELPEEEANVYLIPFSLMERAPGEDPFDLLAQRPQRPGQEPENPEDEDEEDDLVSDEDKGVKRKGKGLARHSPGGQDHDQSTHNPHDGGGGGDDDNGGDEKAGESSSNLNDAFEKAASDWETYQNELRSAYIERGFSGELAQEIEFIAQGWSSGDFSVMNVGERINADELAEFRKFNQDRLKQIAGGDTIVVYRGVYGKHAAEVRDAWDHSGGEPVELDFSKGDSTSGEHGAYSSWTTDLRVARAFASQSSADPSEPDAYEVHGVVMKARIPVSRIALSALTTLGWYEDYANQNEVVVNTKPGERIRVRNANRKKSNA